MRNAALEPCRGQRGINQEAVAAAVDHILEHHHAQLIAQIIEHLRLDLNVLTQHVKAHFLGGQNVVFIALRAAGQIDAVREIALIQQSVEEIGLAVEADARCAAHVFHTHGAQREIGLDLVLTRPQRKLIQIRVLGRPKHGGFGLVGVRITRKTHGVRTVGGLYGHFVFSRAALHVQGHLLGIGVNFDGLYIGLGHLLQPYGLPNATDGGVPHTAAVHALLAPAKIVIQLIGNDHSQMVGALLHLLGDIPHKGQITATLVTTYLLVIE